MSCCFVTKIVCLLEEDKWVSRCQTTQQIWGRHMSEVSSTSQQLSQDGAPAASMPKATDFFVMSQLVQQGREKNSKITKVSLSLVYFGKFTQKLHRWGCAQGLWYQKWLHKRIRWMIDSQAKMRLWQKRSFKMTCVLRARWCTKDLEFLGTICLHAFCARS